MSNARARLHRLRRVVADMSGRSRVWALLVVISVVTAAILPMVGNLPDTGSSRRVPFWALALAFYAAEFAVVHLRFRNDAHSFSLSEIPLIVGLFFSNPLDLVFAQLLANTVVQIVHRRLPAVKVAFNLSQFALQTALAIGVFRVVATAGDPFGPAGWLAAAAAAVTALITADLLINTAIRLSGGRLDRRQMLEVLGLSLVAALMNVSLGLVGVMLLANDPQAAWLALAPPAILYLSYRAYVSQRQEGSRLQSLYEATRALHGSPQIESALLASAEQACQMLEAEFVEVVLFPVAPAEDTLYTAVGPGDRRVVLEPVKLDLDRGIWPQLRRDGTAQLLGRAADALLGRPDRSRYPADEVVVAPLVGHEDVVGAIVVANRLGDVSHFDADDVDLLEALARQVGVSLDNGRLEDSLAQLTELKDRLEALVRSKDEFVASVSHELRTPLTAIYGLSLELQARREAFSVEELDQMVGLIAEQSSDLSNMIEDLLVAARAELETMKLNLEQVDLVAEAAAVVDATGTAAQGRLPIQISGEVAPVVADPLRVRQILRNLLTNADRYGGDDVRVELFAGNRYVVVAVVDDGPGVPPGFEESIFHPYQSAHAVSTQPSSVGLGLAVSRRLARLMGGDLHYSRRDDRTRFELRLERNPAGADGDALRRVEHGVA